MAIKQIQGPSLHPKQQEIFVHQARYRVLACGRRWGKTRMGVAVAIDQLLRGRKTMWVAPTHAVSRLAWAACKAALRPLITSAMVEVREAEKILRAGSGEVIFKSAEKGNNLRGDGLDMIVFDEAAYLDGDEVWHEVLRPSLAERKGRAIFMCSPRREQDWFHRLYLKGQDSTEPDYQSWQLPSWTNPYLDPIEIEAAKQDMPIIDFRREFGAEFVSAEGALLRPEWVKQAPVDVSALGGTVSMGVDLAISTKTHADYTAIVVLRRTVDGRVYVIDAQRARLPFDQVLSFVRRMAEQHRPQVVAIEQVQYQAAVIQELHRTTTLPVVPIKPEGDKVSRFLPLQTRYEQGLVYHCVGVPRDFESEVLSFPDSVHDDQVDAMSYAWIGLARHSQQVLYRGTSISSPRSAYISTPVARSKGRLSGYVR
jgi:predicted phage terminase large subunit-like protein